jgi:histone acetyltransferase 1
VYYLVKLNKHHNVIFKLTVEDPSDDFQRLRDFLDARNCSMLPSFQPRMLEEGFQKEMAAEAKTKLKINKVSIYVLFILV